jgi:hypothetical protein
VGGSGRMKLDDEIVEVKKWDVEGQRDWWAA